MKYISLLFIAAFCIACGNSSPEARVHKLLTERIQTLATAESCTGGAIAARFTAMPGASAYFKGGLVAYSNSVKSNQLNISPDTLAHYSEVSEQVVRLMAENIRDAMETHYAIATTGIAGPTGGTPEHPVGTVWIAVCSPLGTTARLLHLQGDRTRIIREASTAAIELLEAELLADRTKQ